MRRAIGLLRPGLRDVDYRTIEHAVHFVKDASHSGQIDLAAGLKLELEGERLWLATWEADLPEAGWPQIGPGVQLCLDVPGEIILSGGWRLRTENLPANPGLLEQARSDADPYQAWLDQAKLVLPLTVRARQPGERFRPHGMGGHSMKLSDFMINNNLPRRGRNGWPLIFSGDAVAWVPGYRIKVRISQLKQAPPRWSAYHPSVNHERRGYLCARRSYQGGQKKLLYVSILA